MIKNLWQNRRSVILSWLLSYLSILLLPILISVFVYQESSKALEGEIHRANEALLSQVRENIDNQLDSITRLNSEITWHTKVQDLMFTDKLGKNDYQFSLYQIVQELRKFKTPYAQITNYYVYYSPGDVVLSPEVMRSSKEMYDEFHKDSAFSYEAWMAMLHNQYSGFIPLTYRDERGSTRQSIAYVTHLSSKEKEKPEGTVVIYIDSDKLLHAVQNVQLFNGGEVLLLDQENRALLSSKGETYKEQDSETYFIHSKFPGLTYVTTVPSNLVWQKAIKVRNFTIFSIFLSIFGGGLLTYFFLRRNYNPISRIVQTFRDKSDVSIDTGHNEFQFIQHMISNTLTEKEQVNVRLMQQNYLLRSNFMTRLLKGRLENQISLEDSLTAYRMQFDNEYFAVLLFYVEANDVFFDTINGSETDKLKLLQFIVTNVVEEIINTKHTGYMTEMDDMLACIINFNSKGRDEDLSELRQIASQAQQFLKNKYKIDLTVSISSVHTSIAGITSAYKESVDAMEYKLILGDKEILSFDEIRKETLADITDGYYYPLQLEQHLINFMKIGDYDKAKEALDDIIERNLKNNPISVSLARCLMFDLVSTMVKALHEIGDVLNVSHVMSLERIEKLTECESIQDMHVQLTRMLKEVCDITLDKRKSNQLQSRQNELDELSQSMIDYIREQYHNVNLNITMIGDRFQMRPTYLSRLFKEQTGEGLLDYINKVRIEKAKELIMNQKLTMHEISTLVGFSESNTFIRTFKKHEGVTPGKFKEISVHLS
ncbi:AraC family transcriptional regulator [Paenibacillus contaminans]|nr:AraC family transcriptional regulator [Paenibacillus contaminans]